MAERLYLACNDDLQWVEVEAALKYPTYGFLRNAGAKWEARLWNRDGTMTLYEEPIEPGQCNLPLGALLRRIPDAALAIERKYTISVACACYCPHIEMESAPAPYPPMSKTSLMAA